MYERGEPADFKVFLQLVGSAILRLAFMVLVLAACIGAILVAFNIDALTRF